MSERQSHDGQNSIYFDATEQSQLIDDHHLRPSNKFSSSSNFPEEDPSPWNSELTTPAGNSNQILPPSAHGYLNFGVHGAGASSGPLSETETTTVKDDESIFLTNGMENSYMSHLRAQSFLPKKWLNDIDIEPYMNIPGKNGKFARRDGMSTRKNYLKEPLLEELLPTSRKESLFPAINGPVQRKDRLAAIIYTTLMSLMMLIGIILCFIYPSELRDKVLRSSTLLQAIADSSWVLVTAIVLGCLVSALWTVLLGAFTREIVYLMVYFTPVVALISGLWSGVEFLHGESSGRFWLLLGSIAGITASILFITFILANKKSLSNTISVIKMTSDILKSNPGIYISSALLLLIYFAFIGLWLIFYTHALMLGRVVDIPAGSLAKAWQLSTFSYWIQAFFIFMLLWTSIIFSYVQKSMIGGVVGRWYFFGPDSERPMNTFNSWDALLNSYTNLFGQVCLASLLLSFVRITRGFVYIYNYVTSKLTSGVLESALKSVNLFFGFIERLFEHVTDLAIYFSALTGEGFWSSGKAVLKIFRRNMLLGFSTDLIAQALFIISTTSIAAIIGLSNYIFITHGLHSKYGIQIGVLFSLLIWYVLRFFTSIYSDTMDASFICFAIDLDTEKLHCPSVHQAFSHRVSDENNIM